MRIQVKTIGIAAALSCALTSCVTLGPAVTTKLAQPVRAEDVLVLDIHSARMSVAGVRRVAAILTSALYRAKICKEIFDLQLAPNARGTAVLSIEVHEIASYPVFIPSLGTVTFYAAKANIQFIDFETRRVLGELKLNTDDLERLLALNGISQRSTESGFLFGLLITRFLQGESIKLPPPAPF